MVLAESKRRSVLRVTGKLRPMSTRSLSARRHQRALWNTLARLEWPCPPGKFGVIRRVVEAKRFGELRGIRQLRAQLVGDDVEPHGVGGNGAVATGTQPKSQSGGSAKGSRSVRRSSIASARRR